MIRVGRLKYENGRTVIPRMAGFQNIIVMTEYYRAWWELSSFKLTDNKGRNFETFWQSCKVYATVPRSVQRRSKRDRQIIWDHPAERHVIDGKLTPAYYAWREKLQHIEYPVRYPATYHHRHKCLYALAEDPSTGEIDEKNQLDYIASRKAIYVPNYIGLVIQEPKFAKLKKKLLRGKNLLIIEVDGPHQESMSYYRKTYEVNDDFITYDSMIVNEKNIEIMLNDEKHPFGHGYCLAMALLGMDIPRN